MTFTLKPAVVAALLSLLPLPVDQICAGAAEERFPGYSVVLSEGMSTCGEFIAEPQMQTVRLSWVLGYITGRNVSAPPGKGMTGSSFQQPATAIGWLNSYCTAHALDTLVIAAERLREDFVRQETGAR
jgi:hypothetical protein